MNISVRQLKAFLHVSRLKSFTRAAEQMHITQAGLSSMIQDLESQLDARLFDRTTRAVVLTAAGLRLLPTAEQVVSDLENALIAIGQMEAKSRETLAVAATPIVAATVMPAVCKLFNSLHPHVTVRVLDVDRDEIRAMVETGAADVGFGIFLKPAQGIERRELMRGDLVFLSPSVGGPPTMDGPMPVGRVPWAKLGQVPLMGLPSDNPVQQVVDAHLARIGRANEERLVFNNFQTLLGMVEASRGATILPSMAVAAARRLHVRVELLVTPVVPVSFYQINQKGRRRAPAEEAFVKCLLDIMGTRCALLAAPDARVAPKRAGKRRLGT